VTLRSAVRPRAVALGVALALAAPARGQFWRDPAAGQPKPTDVAPPVLQDVRIDERLGNKVPLDLPFVDWNGAPFAFRSAFDGKKPVVLALVYYNCPMLCGLVLSGMAKGMRENGLVLGKDFEAVTVSFDPAETPAQGAERRRGYLQSIGLPDAGRTWPFLVGTEQASRALADAVGFHYAKDAATGQWAHLAAIFVLAPDGTVSRYLYGIEYPPKDLRLALVEAADGRVGTSLDRFLLTCYRYDPASRKYEPYAIGIMRAGGALALAGLVALIGTLVWRERKTRARNAA
jgi:protein SCO1/2